jgi:hypothetical protein
MEIVEEDGELVESMKGEEEEGTIWPVLNDESGMGRRKECIGGGGGRGGKWQHNWW